MTKSKEITVLLTSPQDWHVWFEHLQRTATGLNVWSFVDPDGDATNDLIEPKIPTVDDYLDEIHASLIRAHIEANRDRDPIPPAPPRPQELADGQRKILAERREDWKLKDRVYSRQLSSYNQLFSWVNESVSSSWMGLTPPNGTLRAIVKELKRQASPTTTLERVAVQTEYREALKTTKSVNVDNWYQRWEKARKQAVRCKFSELDDPTAVKDFLDAVSVFLPTFAEYQKNRLNDLFLTNSSDIPKLDAIGLLFHNAWRDHEATKSSKRAGGIFATTLQGQGTEDNACPCGFEHKWTAAKCEIVRHVVLGTSFRLAKRPKKSTLEACRKRLQDDSKWKQLAKDLREKENGEAKKQDQDQAEKPDLVAFIAQPTSDQAKPSEGAFTTTTDEYPLKWSFILDGGSTVHACNQRQRFIDFVEPTSDEYVFAGDSRIPVEGRGTVKISVNGPDGASRQFTLLNVAFLPHLHTSIVSEDLLERKGFWKNGYTKTVNRGAPGKDEVICHIQKKHGQNVLEYNEFSSYLSVPSSTSIFVLPRQTRRKKRTSRDPKPPRADTADIWHLRMGHLGPEALERLVFSTRNVRIRGIPRKECQICSISKASRIISRRESEARSRRPFYRVCLDLFTLDIAYNGHKYALVFTDEFSGIIAVTTLSKKSESFQAIVDFEARIKRQFGLSICKFRLDNERSLVSLESERTRPFEDWAKDEGIDIELAPSYTKEPNGTAERGGGVAQEKARQMRISANLPENLWPEFWVAASYLHNRSPRQRNGWKTPLETIHSWFQDKEHTSNFPGDINDLRPDLCNLYAYGCRAYPLITEYKAGKRKIHFKLNARAHIGYLVGYRASTIYRIWVPALEEVITTRDVTFDEGKFFDPKEEEDNQLPIREYRPVVETLRFPDIDPLNLIDESDVETDEYQHSGEKAPPKKSLESPPLDHQPDSSPDLGILTPAATPEPLGSQDETGSQGVRPDEAPDEAFINPEPEPIQNRQQDITGNTGPNSRATPHIGLPQSSAARETPIGQSRARRTADSSLDQSLIVQEPRTRKKTRKILENEAQQSISFLASFFAGQSHGRHQNNLPKLPKHWRDLDHHPLGQEFKNASDIEMRMLDEKKSYRIIDRNSAQGRILPLKWVFRYKFDENGYLTKCKARICVRGDLQPLNLQDTYAATLAGKSFRTLMAIAAKFDLEIDQGDVVSAFINSDLDEEVYCELPDGFKLPGKIIRLLKALYGLRRSPRLWNKDLSATLEGMGLRPSKEDPCVFTNGWLIVFFFVDDIIRMYRKSDRAAAAAFAKELDGRYKMKDEPHVRWFLGIRILRDRSTKKLWLNQSSYIEAIAKKFRVLEGSPNFPSIPLSTVPHTKFEGQADLRTIKSYQEKVGSILYAAINTRPDIARASAELSKYLTNPSPRHVEAVDQTIRYLYATRFLSIEYSAESGEILIVASDASFADDIEDRKSSQGYIVKLFGGPVAWKACKQNTVTTSTTEAELLALEHTAKDTYALERLFRDVALDLGEPVRLFCDNQQTIRLVVSENERITTKLRHVDIQNMWLRQEYRKGKFEVTYVPTADMPADGLTKALPRQRFEQFINHLGLVDAKQQICEADPNLIDEDSNQDDEPDRP